MYHNCFLASEMNYIVSGGALNSTHSLTLYSIISVITVFAAGLISD